MISTSALLTRSVHVRAEWALRIFEVTELATRIQWVLQSDPELHDVWLRGEVSNRSHSSAGHYYFTLKDSTCQMRTVLFRGNALRSPTLPENGMALVAHGAVRFYERQGTCELVADLLFPEGAGIAQMQFEALHRRLEADGLFDTARKRPLPQFPRCIGIVSSEGGAVIHDLLTVLGRRFPLAEVVFLPAAVQGEAAPPQIVRAMRALNAWRSARDAIGVDLIVLARGGGSADDLAAFNDERVVRAIFASRVPVVSAVGHETDVTLADLVADLRAPTPSAAAEMIVPDVAALRRDVRHLKERALHSVRSALQDARRDVRGAREELADRVRQELQLSREHLVGRRLQLGALSPLGTMARGYALAEIGGRGLLSSEGVRPGDAVTVRLHHGHLETTVTAAEPR